MAEGRLHPGPDRRRLPRHRGRPRPRQEVQARHRGGGRPPGRARGHRDEAGGQPRAGAEAGRGPGLSGPRRPSPLPSGRGVGGAGWWLRGRRAHARLRTLNPSPAGRGARGPRRQRPPGPDRLLREIRLPRLRLHHRRDRAAPVQLQRPAGRLPRLRRPRREAPVRSRARRPQRESLDQARRRRPLGQVQPAQPLLHAGPRLPRPRVRFQPRDPVERPPRRDPPDDPVRHRRASPSPSASSTASAATTSASRSRA